MTERPSLSELDGCPRCRFPLGPSHIGTCTDCGTHGVELGWEHLCRSCWGAEPEGDGE
jgi:hypothetical protein